MVAVAELVDRGPLSDQYCVCSSNLWESYLIKAFKGNERSGLFSWSWWEAIVFEDGNSLIKSGELKSHPSVFDCVPFV